MSINTFLGRLVVIRAYLKRSVHAHLFRLLRHVDGLRRGIGSRAGNHLNTAGRTFHSQFNHPQMLFHSQRGGFSRSTHGHNPGNAGGHLLFHKHPESLFIDAGSGKRSHNCCIKTLKLHNLTWKHTILTDTFCHDRIQKYGMRVRHPETPSGSRQNKTPGRT